MRPTVALNGEKGRKETDMEIRLRKSTANLIRSYTRFGTAFRDTSIPDGPDHVTIAFDQSTIDRVKSVALPGETLDDTIVRVCSTLKGTN